MRCWGRYTHLLIWGLSSDFETRQASIQMNPRLRTPPKDGRRARDFAHPPVTGTEGFPGFSIAGCQPAAPILLRSGRSEGLDTHDETTTHPGKTFGTGSTVPGAGDCPLPVDPVGLPGRDFPFFHLGPLHPGPLSGFDPETGWQRRRSS
jgi:hypothetical protein